MSEVEGKTNNHADDGNANQMSGVICDDIARFFDLLAKFDYDDKVREFKQKTNENQ